MSAVIDIILTIATIFIPLLGGAITVIGFYFRDVMEKEPKRVVFKTFLWGLFSGVILVAFSIPLFFGAYRITILLSKEWAIVLFMVAVVLVQAIIEETIKGLILRYKCFYFICEVDGLFDGFFYGAIVGTGAGVIDAIAYSLLATDWLEGLQIALIRTIRIPGTHALFTGLLGLYCAWHKYKDKKLIPGIALAVLLHSVWNITTYLFHYYLTNITFYVANFSFLFVYFIIIFVLSTLLINYDRKHFPKGIPDKEICEI
ncbi:MAG: PrsW family intramembrane metalloprotease [Candidatus Heimdallarchaeota archaeon]|nr:PrsW family intramembrane metalloprotease [Candidatus Heimdallarchaeota archaeon]